MGDVQEYFITKNVRNFIRFLFQDTILPKRGANQLRSGITLSNGFTYVEYYLSRGMNINDFGPIVLLFEWC
jgi:methylmalonyl-CoA mutase